MEERLQKLMAQAGIASRREAEGIIERRRVTVNGVIAKLGDKADPEKDDIRVDGTRLHIQQQRIYIKLYKPMGIISAVSAQEQESRRTVRDLIPIEGHLYPVGRLDADSEGLVLLTNDGELAQKLTHPRYEHPKVYEVAVTGQIAEEKLDLWRRGITLDDGLTLPVEIRVVSREKDLTWLSITMKEGRKRQIRRIANLLGHPVRRLIRTELDALKLGTLKNGEWRYLTDSEIQILLQSVENTPQRKRVRVARPMPRKPGLRTGARSGTRTSGSRSGRRPSKSTGTKTGGSPSRRGRASVGKSSGTGKTGSRPLRPGSSKPRTGGSKTGSSRPGSSRSGNRSTTRRTSTRREEE